MKIISVNLNDEREEIIDNIKIIPISDVHLGDKLADLRYLKKILEQIKEEKNTYTIINGDMCNMALKDSKSDVYSEKLTPMEQILQATTLLEPIKDKILVIGTGNHEDRTQKSTGIDVTHLIAKQLGIEDRYANGWWYLYLYFGLKNQGSKRPMVYTITGYHGSGGGRKSGGKINRLEEMSQVVIADLYIMSHTHKPMSTKGIIYIPDYSNKALTKKDLYYLMTNSFLDYSGSYAEKMGFNPSNNSITEANLSGMTRRIKITL